MTSLNRVLLIGRVGKDPEVRMFQTGDFITNFSLATSERWTDKTTGEKKEQTEWHRVSVKNKFKADFASKHIKKGDLVLVEGSLETRKWKDKLGGDAYATEIIIKNGQGTIKKLNNTNKTDESNGLF